MNQFQISFGLNFFLVLVAALTAVKNVKSNSEYSNVYLFPMIHSNPIFVFWIENENLIIIYCSFNSIGFLES